MNENQEIAFSQNGRVIVKGAGGKLTAVNFNFDKALPRPQSAQQDKIAIEPGKPRAALAMP